MTGAWIDRDVWDRAVDRGDDVDRFRSDVLALAERITDDTIPEVGSEWAFRPLIDRRVGVAVVKSYDAANDSLVVTYMSSGRDSCPLDRRSFLDVYVPYPGPGSDPFGGALTAGTDPQEVTP